VSIISDGLIRGDDGLTPSERRMAFLAAGGLRSNSSSLVGADGNPLHYDSGSDERDKLAAIALGYTPVNWADAWKAQPEDVEWLTPDCEWLETGTLNALFSKPGTGKSLVTLETALSIVRSGRTVVYIDDENRVTDLVERLQAFGCSPDELGRLRGYSFAGLPPLDSERGGQHLLALAVTGEASLVVLDTTSRMVAGRENDSDTFLQLYRHSLVPLKARGITVLRLDHPGKDIERGQRGSSAKDGDIDTTWQLTETIREIEYRLERTKTRNGHGPEAFDLRRESEPLRHVWTCPRDSPVSKIMGQLIAWNVPVDAGRDLSRKILSEHGVKVRNSLLSAAIRMRKTCPGQVGDSGDGSTKGQLSPLTPQVSGDRGTGACPQCGKYHDRYGRYGHPCKGTSAEANS
jgi:hypothetical protein